MTELQTWQITDGGFRFCRADMDICSHDYGCVLGALAHWLARYRYKVVINIFNSTPHCPLSCLFGLQHFKGESKLPPKVLHFFLLMSTNKQTNISSIVYSLYSSPSVPCVSLHCPWLGLFPTGALVVPLAILEVRLRAKKQGLSHLLGSVTPHRRDLLCLRGAVMRTWHGRNTLNIKQKARGRRGWTQGRSEGSLFSCLEHFFVIRNVLI